MRLIIIISCILWLPVDVAAQGTSSADNVKAERSKSKVGMYSDSTSVERVVSPAADPRVFYDPYQDVHRVQNGIYFGPKNAGMETTYRIPESAQYVNLFLGIINPRESGTLWTGGFSLGREFRLNTNNLSRRESNVEYYFRAGPGLGLAGRGTINGQETKYFMGLNSTVYVGAQYHISEKTSLFIHGGGKIFWFPALNEVGFSTVPVISFGLQFSTSSQIPLVRF